MQLKSAKELGREDLVATGLGLHLMLFDGDDCGLCGEDLPGQQTRVYVVAEIEGEIRTNECDAYVDSLGVIRVANTEELVRCFA